MSHGGPSSPGVGVGGAAPADVLDRVVAQVGGFMSRDELELIRALAAASTGPVVELGAFAGRSTIALCLGARDAGMPVTTVDIWSYAGEGASEEVLRSNLAAFDCSAHIIKSVTWQAASQFEGQVGFLFVDADHALDAVLKDLAAWGPRLLPDGVVAFDDYDAPWFPDVKQAADTWAARDGWRPAEVVGKVQVFRRAAAAVVAPPTSPGREAADDPAGTGADASADTLAQVRGYLDALAARDVDRCVSFFADDATLSFMGRTYRGRQEIDRWHRERFKAGMEVLEVRSVRQAGESVHVETIATSNILRMVKIGKLGVRTNVILAGGKIRQAGFGVSAFSAAGT